MTLLSKKSIYDHLQVREIFLISCVSVTRNLVNSVTLKQIIFRDFSYLEESLVIVDLALDEAVEDVEKVLALEAELAPRLGKVPPPEID